MSIASDVTVSKITSDAIAIASALTKIKNIKQMA
jgi:hypothetical protein